MAKDFLCVGMKQRDGHLVLHQVLLDMVHGFFTVNVRVR